MKKYGSFIKIRVSFEKRSEVYDFLQDFRDFLDKCVPVGNFDFQDIKLFYRREEVDVFGDRI